MEKLYSVTATINLEDKEIETQAELVNMGALEDFITDTIEHNHLASSFVFVVANH